MQADGIVHNLPFAYLQGDNVGTTDNLGIICGEDVGMELAALHGASVDRLVIVEVNISDFVAVNVDDQVRTLTCSSQGNPKSSAVAILSVFVLDGPDSSFGLRVIPANKWKSVWIVVLFVFIKKSGGLYNHFFLLILTQIKIQFIRLVEAS